MTTRLEKRTRELADEWMETFPGVTRQEAKRRVRQRAQQHLLLEDVRIAVGRFGRAVHESVTSGLRRDMNKNRS